MNIIEIKDDNLILVENFLANKIPNEFRYFKSRTLDCIKNHKLTLIGVNSSNEPIGYAHIDNENGINWIGICLLEEYQGKKYGKQLMNYVLNYVDENGVDNVQLTVDIDNWKAISLYTKNNFKIIKQEENHYRMKLVKSILLEVSLGEALDKLTILDIKKQKIKDDRIHDVEKEYKLLYNELKEYIIQNDFYYNILRDINLKIWEMQDVFRDSKNENEKNKLCILIIDENDRRFRIKKKINEFHKSSLKEQKGYKIKEAFVLTHLGLGDNITSIGAVRFLSTFFDKVTVVCKNTNYKNMMDFYSDDTSISIYPIENDKFISPRYGFPIDKLQEIVNGKTLFLCGFHMLDRTRMAPMCNLPFNFYKDLGMKPQIFRDYFYIPQVESSKKLYEEVKKYKYVFIHNVSSTGKVFEISNKIENDLLVINPDYNFYSKDHKFFEIAEKFVYKPLIHYTTIIENADSIYLTDSSFFCLALNLKIKTEKCFYISRGSNGQYSHLFLEKNGFDKSKHTFFHHLKEGLEGSSIPIITV